ncbi:MlaD family protein [Sulfurimonas sp.]|uniref:MlaD family protein n=1 Tax=Sulfurimonas sp. TaxID=2022749 RepID=UPI0025D6FB8C|nr:MlaD family protein [Sulfurimonas sp.]MDD5158246.1 MlaD family protein [Sulfurimonas sp.]
MNNKVNYGLVGFLVLIGISLMLGFGYWLLKPAKEAEVQKYSIYFSESILGLNIDAPVKYRGISVGKVVKLSINEKNAEQVEVLVEVLKSAPINSLTLAQLTSQGITGLSYVNLIVEKGIDAKALETKNDEKYPVIKSVPSLLVKLESTFSEVAINLAKTLEKTQELLGKENQHDISQLLKNSVVLVDKMNRVLDDKTIDDFHKTMQTLDSTTKQIEIMVPKVTKLVEKSGKWEDDIAVTFSSIMKSYLGIKATMDNFRDSLDRGDFNMKDISNNIFPTMNSTMIEMQELMIRMNEAIEKYERNPRDMLFKQERVKKAPGEN